MNKESRQLSLVERWKLDIKAHKEGGNLKKSSPQCELCKYFIKGDALHCEIYKNEKKPKYVMFCYKECPSFTSSDLLEINIIDNESDRLYGGIFGFCVGDMLGVPVEFSSRQERKNDEIKELRAYGTYNQPFGTWSDDTSLMLCLIDAINRGFTIENLANNFISFYKDGLFTPHGEVFDIGVSTQNAIEKMINGINPIECGGKCEDENGNGSLMRILPIAFLQKKCGIDNTIKMVEDVSSLTHLHDRSKLACIFYVELASQLIENKNKKDAYNSVIEFVKTNCKYRYFEEFKYFDNILNKRIINMSENQIKSTGYVIDTLEAVLWLFMNFDSYEQMVLGAVNLGGDTDTIAAIVGGLAGIYYGFSKIPNKWIQTICRKKEIKEMISNFESVIKS